MMRAPVPLMLVMLSASLAAPRQLYDDYHIAVPQKKAALVLDRLLIALQKALHDAPPSYERIENDGPRTAPLRIGTNDMSDSDVWLGADDLRVAPLRPPTIDDNDLSHGDDSAWYGPDELRVAPIRPHADDMTGLQRRGQASGAHGVRGRVLRCYFNAITCF